MRGKEPRTISTDLSMRGVEVNARIFLLKFQLTKVALASCIQWMKAEKMKRNDPVHSKRNASRTNVKILIEFATEFLPEDYETSRLL